MFMCPNAFLDDLKTTLKLSENYLSVCVCTYMLILQLLN